MAINIAAVTTGAFLGLLALVALVACIPPITRFLGDLFCCPWRIPFTKKKRLNDDEEVDRAELPYATGEPRPGTPVDVEGYQRTSRAHMSAVSVIDPETAKEGMRRSADYRRSHSPNGDWRRYDPYGAQYGRDDSPPEGDYYHYQHHHHQQDGDAYAGQHLQVPHAEASQHGGGVVGGSWRPSPERPTNYPPADPYHSDPYHSDGYSPEYDATDALAAGYMDVRRPAPSHPSPGAAAAAGTPEMSMVGHGRGYFPPRDYHGQQAGAGPQQQQWTNV